MSAPEPSLEEGADLEYWGPGGPYGSYSEWAHETYADLEPEPEAGL